MMQSPLIRTKAGRRADREIWHDVRQALHLKGRGKLNRVFCMVRNGQVILRGHVATVKQRQQAIDIARRQRGVRKVVNQLRLRTGSSRRHSKDSALVPLAASKSV